MLLITNNTIKQLLLVALSKLAPSRPWHIEFRHRVKRTSTINLLGFETLKLKIRRLKLLWPTVRVSGSDSGLGPIHFSFYDFCLYYFVCIILSLSKLAPSRAAPRQPRSRGAS